MKPKKRVGLFGLFGIGNYGNDASLDAMVLQIQHYLPDAYLSCVCPAPNKVYKRLNISGVYMETASPTSRPKAKTGIRRLTASVFERLRPLSAAVNWWRTLIYVRRLDVLIMPGTGLLDDYGTSPFWIPYTVFRWCIAARLCRVKILFVSIGAGPILNPWSRWLMKTAAACGTYRSYRDEASKSFMQRLGLDTSRDCVYPDLVFSLSTCKGTDSGVTGKQNAVVGIGVMNYRGWNETPDVAEQIYRTYVDKISVLIVGLLRRGYRVRLVVGEANDETAARDVVRALGSRVSQADIQELIGKRCQSIRDVFEIISCADVVAVTRFHNVVCALMLGVPVVSVGYAEKNKVLLSEMGLADFCQPVENFSVDWLLKQIERLLTERAEHHSRLVLKAAQYRKQLDVQFADVLSGCRN